MHAVNNILVYWTFLVPSLSSLCLWFDIPSAGIRFTH